MESGLLGVERGLCFLEEGMQVFMFVVSHTCVDKVEKDFEEDGS